MSKKKQKVIYCRRCGKEITEENGYVRKNGTLINPCKKCNTDVCYMDRYKLKTEEEIQEEINNHLRRMKLLKEVLSDRYCKR